MSAIKYSKPPNRLDAALSSARPLLAQRAIERATQNLAHLGDECAAYVDQLLGSLRELFDLYVVDRRADALADMYQLSLRFIGAASLAGCADLEVAAKSLCDVIDGMLERGETEPEPIRVHIEAMRMLRHPAALGGAGTELLAGLQRVRVRFAMSSDATSPDAKTSDTLVID